MNTQLLEEFSASNDHIIVKGKRTKRPRPSSSASSGGGGDFNCNSLLSSPTSSSGISTSTEEDEDLANCLILLARGGLGPQPQTERAESSRKFTEMAATANVKVGIYVYECKTCSRTFPSFQALGGHRASHKKPKSATDFDQRRSTPPPKNRVKEEEDTIAPTPQLLGHVENKPKIHECSICGSEFASGQALGGHMRRHRSGHNISTAAAAKSDDSSSHDDDHHVVEKTRRILTLDLNLPAPPEEDRREAEFRAFSSNQQPRMVFAAAALVDCHY